MMIIEIDDRKYRQLETIWNRTQNLKKVDICPNDKWVMIDGIEYEELDEI